MATTQIGDGDVGLSAFLGEDEETFRRAVETDTAGPVAVVGSPFGGREAVLRRAAERLEAPLVWFDADTDPATAVDALAGGPVVIDGCHHLYTRSVGGFRPFSRFLDALAETERTVVTGWNRFAWSYLDSVRNVGNIVPSHVEVGGLSGAELAAIVEANTTQRPTFRRDDHERNLLTVRDHTVAVADRSVSVPVPAVDREALVARRTEDLDPKTATFERLAAVSDGNPGAALEIWERCVTEEVRPTDIEAPNITDELDREAAFCLRLVLSTERLDRAMLTDRIGPRTPRLIGRFARAGVLSSDDGVVRLEPAGVPAAIAATERRNVL